MGAQLWALPPLVRVLRVQLALGAGRLALRGVQAEQITQVLAVCEVSWLVG